MQEVVGTITLRSVARRNGQCIQAGFGNPHSGYPELFSLMASGQLSSWAF
jgi:hypothetical protein